MSFSAGLIYAEKLDIEIGNNYIPGEDVKFKLVLYGDSNNRIDGEINYVIQNYYKEEVLKGIVNSGEEVIYNLPENAIQGPWKIIADYNEISVNRLFNVGELEKAEISLEGDILILRNIGNTPYNKKILIYIGNNDQTADVFLEIGQVKKIRLTAPDGNYDIRVVEGNEEQALKFENVQLTGNVVGLESVLEGSFWKKYPIVSVFLGVLLLVIIIISILKFINRKDNKKKKQNKK